MTTPTSPIAAVKLLREARATLEMWKDVAPAVSLCADIDRYLAASIKETTSEYALNTRHDFAHKAADAFWIYWKANGETHKHGYYESTWGAINRAIRMVGVVPHDYDTPAPPALPASPDLGNPISMPAGAPVDERAPDVIAWLLLDQGFREPDDFEDFERVVLASEITAEELARFKKDGRATALSVAALQQPGLADKVPAAMISREALAPYDELIFAVHRKFPDESRHQTALRYIRQAEELKTTAAKSAPPKDKP